MATVLITGCSSGFGKLAALQFARKGDTVYASMRNTSKGTDLEEARDSEDLKIELLQLDVTDDASVSAAVAKVIAEEGQIDVLVNNAGIVLIGAIEESDDGESKEIFETNFFGALRVIRAVLPHMRKQGAGTIVNVSSVGGRFGSPFVGTYAASKHALEAASEALYYEVHPFGVRVLLIEPGSFRTRMAENPRVARGFREGSPYMELQQRIQQTLTPPVAGPDPQVVAEAIYDAVNDKEPKLRYLVGKDAEMIGGLRQQLDDEQFEKALRQALDFWD